eukprot:CAMPEP_0197040530 /NCGR_PEP_ID=MMETSP1384-20130603/17215_1 /TAXON_ID=29189 /ORGANISM="Ammonia sp." /LENGTH=359 /DNA_ID=CAMNT_0042471305 /DNA_START=20 /DNA_END=1099 /DNA_ORIENTATION=-
MAQLMMPTCTAEGTDDLLQEFFAENESKLKQKWYKILVKAEITYDDLMESKMDILRLMLDSAFAAKYGQQKSKIYTGKMITVIRRLPESQIYADDKQTKVSVISSEENDVMTKILAEHTRMKEMFATIPKAKQSLEENSQSEQDRINQLFDKVIYAVNERRSELLEEVSLDCQRKVSKLQRQGQKIKARKSELSAFYQETQSMLKDASMNRAERKREILARSAQVFTQDKDVDLLSAKKERIAAMSKVDINSVIHAISEIGQVRKTAGGFHSATPYGGMRRPIITCRYGNDCIYWPKGTCRYFHDRVYNKYDQRNDEDDDEEQEEDYEEDEGDWHEEDDGGNEEDDEDCGEEEDGRKNY